MAITDLATIRGKLAMPVTDTSLEFELTSVWQGVEAHVLGRTRYAVAPGQVVGETHSRVQIMRAFYLRQRPVATVDLILARPYGQGNWTTLGAELLDPEFGKIVPLGGPGWLWPTFPPTSGPPAEWTRWQATTWPIVQVTYTIPPFEYPDDLKDATAALAAFWFERHRAGALSSLHESELSEDYLRDFGIPPWIEAVLFRHRPPRRLSV